MKFRIYPHIVAAMLVSLSITQLFFRLLFPDRFSINIQLVTAMLLWMVLIPVLQLFRRKKR